MLSTITLFEHESRELELTDSDFGAVERLRHALKSEVLRATPLRNGKARLQAFEHVGVIRLSRLAVQVLPKIHQSSSATDRRSSAREATRNLLHLLKYAGDFLVREHALAPMLQRDQDWFEILTRLFVSHLMQEWQRGAVKGYTRFEDDLPVLKGKWLIADQLRHPVRQHIFSVAYDEFTADNPLNRVFRYVVERLWRLTRDAQNRQLLGTLRHWMDEITLLPRITVQDADQTLVTRLHPQYEPLLNLGRLFLDNGTLQLAAGELNTFSFVFDMNKLFEGFVVNFIRRHRQDILPENLQGCSLHPQSRGESRYLAKQEDRLVFQLRPDLAVRATDNSFPTFPLLIDTKYKRLDETNHRLGISTNDFYQMFAYAHRYQCPRVLLIYPQTADMEKSLTAKFTVEESDKAIEAATVDLRLDLATEDGRAKLRRDLKRILSQEVQE